MVSYCRFSLIMKKKVALITGGSRGIGLGIAHKLAEEGWQLAINGMRPEEQVGSLAVLRKHGQEVLYCQGNVSTQEGRSAIMEKLLEHYGQLNVLVNNAGVAPKERLDLLDTSEASYDRVMDTNLKSAFFLSQAAAKAMIASKKEDADFPAAIINMSSISATIASVNRAQYCISKAGMGMLTQVFAARLGTEGIPVYEVRPGIIQTDMTAAVKEKYDQLIGENELCITPRWGYPEDVGLAVAALVRGDFPYSTGQVIMVDGGLSIPRL